METTYQQINSSASLPLCLSAFSLLTALSGHAAVITTMTATGSSANNTTFEANLISPGITEVNPSDITTWTHDNINWGGTSNSWWSGESSTPFIEFDLGGSYTVTDAHIWNYNGAADINLWNAVEVTLIFSEDATFGNGDDSSQALTLSPASGLTTYTGEHFALTPVADVTNVRLEITSTGSSSLTGLSEVRFSAVPEPSAALLIGFGGVALLLRRRRA